MDDELVTAAELAARLRLGKKTPATWVRAGRLGPHGEAYIKLPGGQYRFRLARVMELIEGMGS